MCLLCYRLPLLLCVRVRVRVRVRVCMYVYIHTTRMRAVFAVFAAFLVAGGWWLVAGGSPRLAPLPLPLAATPSLVLCYRVTTRPCVVYVPLTH